MKISELIQKLEDVRIGFGNVNVNIHYESEDKEVVIIKDIVTVAPQAHILDDEIDAVWFCDLISWKR